MAAAKSDLPQGTLDLLILKAVAAEPVHGYAIAQRLEQVSRGVVQVPEGSLYPALHRLENRGFLAADWKKDRKSTRLNSSHPSISPLLPYTTLFRSMAAAKSDLPQGTLDLLILKAVAAEPVHGYAIAQRLEQVSRGVVQVPEGSLYPALHRLENRGFLAADWK